MVIMFDFPGAVHADDLGYVFMPAYRKFPPPGIADRIHPEIIVKSRMVRLITNFVRSGYVSSRGI